MDTVTLIVAAVALFMAWGARGRAQTLADELSATRRELLSRGADEGDVAGELTTLRRQVELLAKGVEVDPLMVREKRLYSSVNTDVLAKRLEGDANLAVVDVRTDNEWKGGHIEGARHIPVDQLEQRLSEVPRDGTPLYMICAAGSRSAGAAEFLAKRGYLHVHDVQGGMNSWRGKVVQG